MTVFETSVADVIALCARLLSGPGVRAMGGDVMSTWHDGWMRVERSDRASAQVG